MPRCIDASPSLLRRWHAGAAALLWCALLVLWPAAWADAAPPTLAQGIEQRQQGQLALSVHTLRRVLDTAASPAEALRTRAELGASLLQARRLEEADAALAAAYDGLEGQDRAAVALDRGNVALLRGWPDIAGRYFTEAIVLAGGDPRIRLAARLNQARLLPIAQRQEVLMALLQEVASQPPSAAKTRWQINLARQLRQTGVAGQAPAHAQLVSAREAAAAAAPAQARLLSEALDALAQLYEDQGRHDEALVLTRQALASADGFPPGAAGDLLIQLEWRQARLLRVLGRAAASLAAYERAVRQIEAVRLDLPIEDVDGSSSFRTTLQPVYFGLVAALLNASDSAAATQRASYLRQAIDTVELVRQSELQDYLGDRCEVDAVKGGSATVIPRGTAVLYPVVLAERLELLLETADGITRRQSPMAAPRVVALATAFAGELRNGTPGFMTPARQLYDAVLRPLEPELAAQGVHTLVVAPDGALRLVAMGAFHDGARFAIEKFAIATTTGLSMTNTSAPSTAAGTMLVAGMSDPGPVVTKLSPVTVARLLGDDAADRLAPGLVASRSVRALRALPATRTEGTAASLDPAGRTRALREALALPGVDQEVAALAGILPGRQLLNASFTVDRFRRAAESGDYQIIHVASHGVFGGSAEASYILAYDDLLTLDGLQTLLRSDAFRRNPIELLSLSACETAEGDERSPLGISGAAMKARAKSVLGSLWPVADEAAVQLMARFYQGLVPGPAPAMPLGKAQALQRSQIALLRNPEYAHPFFWAPFILIGNWL